METQGSVSPTDTAPVEPTAQETTQQPETPTYKGTKHKLVIDGKEEELDYDDVLSYAQKAKASDKKFSQAAEMRKAVENFMENLQQGQDYDRLVQIMGEQRAIEWAEKLLLKKLEYDEMTPEQKRIFELEQRTKSFEEMEKKRKAEEENHQRMAARNQAVQEIDTEIGEALQSLGRRPTPRLVARIAEQMLASLSSQDGKRMPANEAMKRVLSEYQQDHAEYFNELSVEEALKVLPKKLLDGIRKAQVEAITSPLHGKTAKKTDSVPITKNKRRMTSDDWFSSMEKKLQGV